MNAAQGEPPLARWRLPHLPLPLGTSESWAARLQAWEAVLLTLGLALRG